MLAMLSLKNISAGYGKIGILNSISLDVGENKITSIIGSNGAGKSTILKTIMGIIKPFNGEIIFKGEEISKRTTYQIASLGISLIPEDRKLFPDLKVFENLRLGAFNKRPWKNLNHNLNYIYEIFPILAKRRNTEAGNLSGGEQQMLAIARGLMAEPHLLILDEPSLGLAPKIIFEVYEVIKKISEKGVTILVVEQNVIQALKISDNAYVIENGAIKLSGHSKDLINNNELKQAYMSV